MNVIRGAGGGGKGGGGSGRSPVEAPDSLQSRQYARILDAITEGESEGLVNGLQSVFLNGTRVQNADGSYNIPGVVMEVRNGTQSQSYIPGFGSVESETAVSVEIKAASPVVRTITNDNVNAVRVTVSVPQLTSQDTSTGDLSGTSVSIAIDVQTAGGGFVQKISDTISGKTTSKYQRAYRIELSGDGPWDIRVRRITADSTQSSLQNATYWDSFTEIIDAKLTYPNTALVALSVDAEKFQSIPTRGYEMKGIKVRIPSNYNPETREYTGVWDGTFSIAWTNNPAWVFYDAHVENRYGLGDFIDMGQVDKWTLYQIAQYCDELVPDGFGGMEPRFTCTVYLQAQEEAYQVINNLASVFRGMPFWAAGAITVTQDAPADPVALFTPSNVIGGQFSYSGSSIKARHTVALVSWNDPADQYRQKIEYVEDEEGIASLGVVQTQVVAFGCTSRGQAHRHGRSILYTERMETETVTFQTGLDGLSVLPGEIIQTSDPVRAGVRMGGRLISATTSTATLDSAVTIEGGKSYTLWAVLPDGSVESRAVTEEPGETTTLSVSPDFTAAPQAMAVWVLAASDLVPEMWRVVSVTETNGTQAEITAMSYRPDKYAAIEQDVILEPLQTSAIDTSAATPADLNITESLYLVTSTIVGSRITVSWHGSAQHYELQYRRASGNWNTITTSSSSVDIEPIDPGIYDFSLVAVNALGRRSKAATRTQEIYGKYAPPVDVVGLSITKVSGVALANWTQHPDLDVRIGGRIVVRHSRLLEGATWSDGYIVEEFDGGAVSGLMPLITGTYMAKALDSSGNWSTNAVSFVATEGMVTGFTTVAESVQAPAFSGTKTSAAVVDGALQLGGVTLIDDMTELIDDWPTMDALGGVSSSGNYAFDTYMDLGTVETRRFEADITSLSFDTGDFIDSRTNPIDQWDSVDGSVINDCDVTLYAATTDDDPAGTPAWGPWTPFLVSDFTCRALKFRMDLSSGQATHNIAVSELTVHAKVPA